MDRHHPLALLVGTAHGHHTEHDGCSLTPDCGPHCGTRTSPEERAKHTFTRHCACCCPAALAPRVVKGTKAKRPMAGLPPDMC
jgi:hypothetical protein